MLSAQLVPPVIALSMPASVFVEAVRLAALPYEGGQAGHPAVRYVTDWWNASSAAELGCAHAFVLYVQHGEEWLSGNPEEGWVDAATWARCARPRAEAQVQLQQGRITFVFFKRPDDTLPNGFDAKAVDGSEGVSGGKWPGTTAEGIMDRYALEALCLLPERFPVAWSRACEVAGQHSD